MNAFAVDFVLWILASPILFAQWVARADEGALL